VTRITRRILAAWGCSGKDDADRAALLRGGTGQGGSTPGTAGMKPPQSAGTASAWPARWALHRSATTIIAGSQRAELAAFVDKFLLGDSSANTNVLRSDRIVPDRARWMPWSTPALE